MCVCLFIRVSLYAVCTIYYVVSIASQVRPVDPQFAKGHMIKFSDQYPFMLISQVSGHKITVKLSSFLNL